MLTLLYVFISFIVGAILGALIVGYYIKKTIFSIGKDKIKDIAGNLGVNLNKEQLQKVTEIYKKIKNKKN